MGKITIYGGTITAIGKHYSAGIGGGEDRGNGTVEIWGGYVTAHGGYYGAGIGGGQSGSAGNIYIHGGVIETDTGDYGSGIGGGIRGGGGKIVIDGGTVRARGGSRGPGIGGGHDASAGEINISGNCHIEAYGGEFAAGIGTGMNSSDSGTVNISGGTVIAHGGHSGAGIGAGYQAGIGKIKISGGDITAYGGTKDEQDREFCGAGIGGGAQSDFRTSIIITGGTITANHQGEGAACIGAGEKGSFQGTIEISGGTINASGYDGAAIGAADYGNVTGSGRITISGGTVNVSIDNFGGGAVIGSGRYGYMDGTITISGGTVTAWNMGRGAGIGAGREDDNVGKGGECNGTVNITGGTLIAYANDNGACSIGYGHDGSDLGPFSVYSTAMVHAGRNEENAQLLEYSKRASCRTSHYVRIEPCNHSMGITYTLKTPATAGHYWHCSYCGQSGDAEHTWTQSEPKVCTECGYTEGQVFTVTLLPGDGTGEPIIESVPSNRAYRLPDCSFEAPEGTGLAFIGWQVGGERKSAGEMIYVSADTEITAEWDTTWRVLQQMIDDASFGATITLPWDCKAGTSDTALLVNTEKNITIDLNGHTIDRDRIFREATEDGNVITNEGELVIMDSVGGGMVIDGWRSGAGGGVVNSGKLTIMSGTFDQNWAIEGGAVFNAAGAEFIMKGGKLDNSYADNSTAAAHGGGAVLNLGKMTMSGGTITRSFSKGQGGAIWSSGELKISGGEFTRNEALPGADYSVVTDINDGGALYICGKTDISDCRIENNLSTGNGAAIYIADNAVVTLTDCIITANTANASGGAIYVRKGTLTVTGTTMTGNKSQDGGAIYTFNTAVLTVNSSVIEQNTTTSHGGGGITNNGRLTMTDTDLRENSAYTNGGGLWTDGTVILENCRFEGNKALQYNGGGVCVSGAVDSFEASDCTFTANEANKNGGGLYLYDGVSNTTINGCSFTGNLCKENGGGIQVSATAALTVSGATEVLGNHSGTQVNDLNLADGVKILVGDTIEGSSIGVSVSGISMEEPVVISDGLPGNGSISCFFADVQEYEISENDDEEAVLGPRIQTDITVIVPERNTSFDGGDEYSADGNVVTVRYQLPCVVVYIDSNEKYNVVPAEAVDGETNTYTFTVEEPDITEVILFIKGDCNLDSRFNTSDVSYAQRCVLNKQVPTAFEEFVADVDSNGRLNTADVGLIQRVVLGKASFVW